MGGYILTNSPKLIIVGASGYLGRQLLMDKKFNFNRYGTSTSGEGGLLKLRLDTSSDFNCLNVSSGDTVLLTAAISSPDICANDYSRAWGVNVEATSDFIAWVISRGGKIIYFSSDTVYGECLEYFDETRIPNPAGEYAQMKAEVERRFIGNPFFKTIRLSYVFSSGDKFTEYLLSCVKKDEQAEIFHPFYRSIVHRDDVVEGALALALRWDDVSHKVINFGGPDLLSRVEFAECLKKHVLKNLQLKVVEPVENFFKNRPRVIAMKSEILPILLNRPSRALVQATQIEFK